jgi:RND family efflux transporter MFP subunit
MPDPIDVNDQPQVLRFTPPKRLKLIGLVAGGAALLVVAAGVITRVQADSHLKTWTDSQSIPTVAVIHPSGALGESSLVLPATVQAFYDAPIYARVPGYVRKWYQDIGAHVRAGQVLADIDTPELDQQLVQARADLANAEAGQQLAQTTAKRWNGLVAQDAVSKQEAAEKNGDLAVKSAQVLSAEANVNRLLALESFRHITAPFDGVVTARKTDIGALINAGASGAPGSELFDVADVRKLRIYVKAPQAYLAQLHPGMTAEVQVPEHPGQTFNATLVSTSGAVSDQSGTVLVELQVDNAGDQLHPGDYAQVKFALPASADATLQVPATALLFRSGGLSVAVVGPNRRVQIRRITIARDMGTVVQVASGVGSGDAVIDNPPDSIGNGDLVRLAKAGGAVHAGG